MNAVSVSQLSVHFGAHQVINEVSFFLPKGKVTALIGPNGSGKSTLMKAMLGLLPYEGVVLFDSQSIEKVRGSIAYVPQRFDLDRSFPITVREFLTLPKQNRHAADLVHALEEVGLPQSILSQRIGTLSGGQIQRAFIAQAIMATPAYLFLDEPVSAIDLVGDQALYDILSHLTKEHDTTVLMISHDVSVVSAQVDQVICLNKRLLCSGSPKEALTDANISALYHTPIDRITHSH